MDYKTSPNYPTGGKETMTRAFFKPEPTKPEDSKIAKALRQSLRLAVAGYAITGLFAFAFADVNLIPSWIQQALVLVGSACIVVGSETNTIPTGEAALSKIGTGRFSIFDLLAFLASLGGSLFSILIVFSVRQVALGESPWREFAIVKGPLFLGCANVLDFYGALLELSLIRRDYSRDWLTWWQEKVAWDTEYGITEPDPPALDPSELVFDSTWPEADWPYVRRMTASLNGNRATFDRATLLKMLHERERRPLSDSTVTRHVSRVREGK